MFGLTTALDYRSKATLFVHAHGARYKAAGLVVEFVAWLVGGALCGLSMWLMFKKGAGKIRP